MVKITNKNLLLLAEKYNTDGKKEMYRFIKEHYGIKNPTCILDRMKKASILGYNSNADTFLMKEPSSSQEEKLFMSMDELCSPTVTVHEYPAKQLEKDNNEMQKLIQNLIGDRLLEISRYISISTATKTIIIDKTSLIRDGYRILDQ